MLPSIRKGALKSDTHADGTGVASEERPSKVKAKQQEADQHRTGLGEGVRTAQHIPTSTGTVTLSQADRESSLPKAQNAEQSREAHSDYASQHFDRLTESPFHSVQGVTAKQGTWQLLICQPVKFGGV